MFLSRSSSSDPSRSVLRTLGIAATTTGLALSALALPAGASGTPADDAQRPTAVRSDQRPAERPAVKRVPDLDILRLQCRAATSFDDVVGCAWSETTAETAVGYQLWRIVDRGERELVWRGGLDTTNVLDRTPGDATVVRYAVLAIDADGEIVGRSRADRVVLPQD